MLLQILPDLGGATYIKTSFPLFPAQQSQAGRQSLVGGRHGWWQEVATQQEDCQTVPLCNVTASVAVHASGGLLDVLHQKLLFHHNSVQLMKLSRGNGAESGPFPSVQVLIKKTNTQPYPE